MSDDAQQRTAVKSGWLAAVALALLLVNIGLTWQTRTWVQRNYPPVELLEEVRASTAADAEMRIELREIRRIIDHILEASEK